MRKFMKNESGASLVEYGLLVGLIAVIAIGAVQTLGSKIADVFSDVNNALTGAGLRWWVDGGWGIDALVGE